MRTKMRNTPVSAYSLVAVYITAISLAAAAFGLSLAVIRQVEQKACVFAESQLRDARGRVDAYRQDPPQTEAGRGQQQQAQAALTQAEDLARLFECAID